MGIMTQPHGSYVPLHVESVAEALTDRRCSGYSSSIG
jgi:hypothetical protein